MNLLIGPLLLNTKDRLSESAKVSAMSRLASILLGDFAIGSILDLLGNLILNEDRVDVQYRWVIESFAPGIIDRQLLFEQLQTGVLFIDSMEHLARGKPDLISSFYDFLEFQEFPFFSLFTFFSVFTIFTFRDFHDFSFFTFS